MQQVLSQTLRNVADLELTSSSRNRDLKDSVGRVGGVLMELQTDFATERARTAAAERTQLVRVDDQLVRHERLIEANTSLVAGVASMRRLQMVMLLITLAALVAMVVTASLA
jgi:hypothetical protein